MRQNNNISFTPLRIFFRKLCVFILLFFQIGQNSILVLFTAHATYTNTLGMQGDFTINNDLTNTNSISVSLNMDLSGVVQMRFGNTPALRDAASWEAYSSSKIWTLDSSEGTKIVYAEFENASSNSTYVTDDIIYTLIPELPFTGGLTLWLDAKDAGSITETSGNISQWSDKSGNGYHAKQANGSNQADLLTDKVQFNGSSDYFYLESLNYTSAAPLDGLLVCTVFRTNNTDTNISANWAFLDFDRSDWFDFYNRGDGIGFSYDAGGIKDVNVSGLGINDNAWHVACASYDNSITNDTVISVDGTIEYDANDKTSGLQIGAGQATRYGFVGDGSEASTENGGRNNKYYDGGMAEMVYYDSIVNASDRKDVECYLGEKWGISISGCPAETVAPIASVSYSPNFATSSDILATLGNNSESITVTNNGGSSSYTFTSNGSFTFEFQDIFGNTGSTLAQIDWIDPAAPPAIGTGALNEVPNIISHSGSSSVTIQVGSGVTSITTIQATDTAFNVIGEYGHTSLSGNTWLDINHSQMCNPVAVVSHRGDVIGEVQRAPRVRNKTGTGFQVKVDNYNSTIGAISTDIDYVVMSAGNYDLGGGLIFEAGTNTTTPIQCSATVYVAPETITWSTSFSSTPAVVHTISTENDSSWLVSAVNGDDGTRQSEPTSTKMGVVLQRSFNSCTHVPEDIDYFAVERGHYTLSDGSIFDATSIIDSVGSITPSGVPISFFSTFSSTPSSVLVSQMGENGGNGGYVQIHSNGGVTSSQVFATADEDGPAADRSHALESVSSLAFDKTSGQFWETNTLTYSISGGADSTDFTINATTGVLEFIIGKDPANPTDTNTDGIYEVDIQACDSHCNSLCDTQSVLVNVISAPGGVSANLAVWLKADKGTSTTTDGNTLASWDDQSGNGMDATAVTAPIYRSNTTDSLNFNPVIDFNGTNQYMRNLANGAHSDSYFMVIVPDNEISAATSGQVPFGFDCNSGVISSGTCGLAFAGTVLGSFTLAIPDEVITHALGSSANWRSAESGVSTYDAGKPMLIALNENATANNTDIYETGKEVDNITTNSYQLLSAADYYIGRSGDNGNPFYYDGKVAEVINYSGRVDDDERKRIEAYLSLKYGITLNNGTQDYIASDSSTSIWSTTTAGSFTYNVFGIGRDDVTELSQVQSKSVNSDAVVTLEALGEGSNISPSFIDIQDKEFFTISHNALGNTWTATDAPATYNILSRKWKTQESGDIGTLSLDFDVADSDFNIPILTAGSNYYFIYDSDGDGNLNDEVPIPMINTSGDIWQISGQNLVHDRIFTIATLASSNNIPTDITLSNDNINENVVDATTVGSFATIDADGGDTHSYSLAGGIGDDDNTSFVLTSGGILSIIYSPDYELQNTYSIRIETNDGNGGTYQETFNISINDLGEVITTTLSFDTISDEEKYTVTSGTWSRTTTNPEGGTHSMESDNGGANNTQSCFEIEHSFSATGSIEFYYNTSSQTGDELRFYIDGAQEGSWDGITPWTQFTSSPITAATHTYKWCYIKDGGGNANDDRVFVDTITFPNDSGGDIISPIISSINSASGSLLPGGNHNIIINYSDVDSGINTSSDNITLQKWNGSVWGADIAATGLLLGSKVVNTTSTSYPTDNLNFGKYRYDFDISDNSGNISSTGAIFYIDIPEFIVSTGSIDIGGLNDFSNTFSDTVTITVKTLGAGFDVTMNTTILPSYSGEIMTDWDGVDGYGYDQSPFTGNISTMGSNQNVATQIGNINIDGNKNTYTYEIRLGAIMETLQIGGDYIGNIDFEIHLDY